MPNLIGHRILRDCKELKYAVSPILAGAVQGIFIFYRKKERTAKIFLQKTYIKKRKK